MFIRERVRMVVRRKSRDSSILSLVFSPVGVFLLVIGVVDVVFNFLGILIPFFGSFASTLTEVIFELVGVVGAVWIEENLVKS